jgi:5-methylcytosine-specific restriction enzyme B
MSILDLGSVDGLRAACTRINDTKRATPEAAGWMQELSGFLVEVAAADEANRATVEFQQHLWDKNPVSNPGQGNISVASAIADESFRRWLARESMVKLPVDAAQRVLALSNLHEAIAAKLTAFPIAKTPRLKIFRVLAAFFPEDFTTVAHGRKLRQLCDRMKGPSTANPIECHAFVKRRLTEVLGPTSAAEDEVAWRMAVPWYLYEEIDAETPAEERVTKPGLIAGEEILLPLPAARRRRGLTAIKGYFTSLMTILEYVKQGVSREELLDYLGSMNRDHKKSTLRTVVNILRSELAVIEQHGEEYRLSAQGAAVLDSGDASELGPWLVTRILGVDHVLKKLEEGPESKAELMELLRSVCPAWTTTFVPYAVLAWLLSFKAITPRADKTLELAPMGAEWTAKIHWAPEYLPEETEALVTPPPEATPGDRPGKAAIPSLTEIRKAFGHAHGYLEGTIESLHLGLWSPKVRHFAVLAGISGSGKTRLATLYAQALTGTTSEGEPKRYHIEAVQPAWYDPTPLLGYVSPLKDDSYTRTAFLDFLLRAQADSNRLYVLILDEMNLSHPEQYFAPILSAMETGDLVRLHAEEDGFDGVPAAIPYPPNLAIIGTINMDETTHGLSDKVLDRAFTLEFVSVEMSAYPGWNERKVTSSTRERITQVLTELLGALKPVRMHFGWRVVDDVIDFVTRGEMDGTAGTVESLLDTAVYAKVIPKLRGEESEPFRAALVSIQKSLSGAGLPKSSKRVAEMAEDLRNFGSARFWR